MAPVDGETAIIVPISVVGTLVDTWRRRYDPSSRDGVPPHVTLLYPFVPLDEVPQALSVVKQIFDHTESFEVWFADVERFPGVTWLAPEPAAAFKTMTVALVDEFPQCQPYGGQFTVDEVTPHLTVADMGPGPEHDAVHAEFCDVADRYFVLSERVTSAELIVRGDDRQWRAHTVFDLGAAE